jgi:hypothetical protein
MLKRSLTPEAALKAQPPKNAQEALARLSDVQGIQQRTIRDRIDAVDYETLPPPIVIFMRALRAEMEIYKIPMVYMETWRTAGRQSELLTQGRSRAAPWQSPHQYGLAFDFVSAVRGWNLHPREWAVIGQIGKEVARKRKIPMEWGGDWDFYDPAHWQLKGWRNWKAYMDKDADGVGVHKRPSTAQWGQIMQAVHPSLLKVLRR